MAIPEKFEIQASSPSNKLPFILENQPRQKKNKILPGEIIRDIRELYKEFFLEDDDFDDQKVVEKCYFGIKEAIESILPENYYLKEGESACPGLLWRGGLPGDFLKLISDEKNDLLVSSEKPNASLIPEQTIAYAGEMTKKYDDNNSPLFTASIGFIGDNLNIESPKEKISGMDDAFRIINGKIKMPDVKALIIRLKGNKPGRVLPPKYYQIFRREKYKIAA